MKESTAFFFFFFRVYATQGKIRQWWCKWWWWWWRLGDQMPVLVQFWINSVSWDVKTQNDLQSQLCRVTSVLGTCAAPTGLDGNELEAQTERKQRHYNIIISILTLVLPVWAFSENTEQLPANQKQVFVVSIVYLSHLRLQEAFSLNSPALLD